MFLMENFLAFNSLSIILITVLKVSNAVPTTINSDENQISSLVDIKTEYKVGDIDSVSSTLPTLTSSTFIYYESTHHDDSVSNESENLPNDFVTENTKTTDYIETIISINQDTTQSTLDTNDSSTPINGNKKLTPPLINPFEDFIFEPQEIESTTRKTIETDQQLTNFDTTTRPEDLITKSDELIVDGQTTKINGGDDFWTATVTKSTNYDVTTKQIDDETTKSPSRTESTTDGQQQLTTTNSDDYQSSTPIFTDRPVTESIQVEMSTINLTTDQRDDPTTTESINSGSTQQITEFISTKNELQQSTTSDSVTEMILTTTESDSIFSTSKGQSTTTITSKSDESTIGITETTQLTTTIITTNMIQSTTSDSRSDISAETTTIAPQSPSTTTISEITNESIIDTTTLQIIESTTVLPTQTESQLTTTIEPEIKTTEPTVYSTTEQLTTTDQDEPEITTKLITAISPGIETTTESMIDTTTQQVIEPTTALPTQTEPQLTTTIRPKTEATTEPMVYTTTEQLSTHQDEPETKTQLPTSTRISEITTESIIDTTTLQIIESTTVLPTQTEPQLTTTIEPETEATTTDPQLSTTIKPEIKTTKTEPIIDKTTRQPDEPTTKLITTIKPEIETTTQSIKTESTTKIETTTTKIEDITTESNIPCDCDQSNFDKRPDCQFICLSSSFFPNFHINLTFFGLKIATILSDRDYLICIALGLGFLLLISGFTLRLIHRRKQRKLIAQRNFDILYQDFGTINEKNQQWLADFKYQSSIL